MDIDFWVERWDNNKTGFHQPHVNPYLVYFYGDNGPSAEQRQKLKVFVPLCGKSTDMLWLSQNDYKVLGVECSQKAVKDFYEDNQLNYKHVEKGQSALYQSTDQSSMIEIYQGDFFALVQKDLDDVTDIFDRASLVAFPEELRKQYATKMAELQKPQLRTLLVTLTFDQSEMNGPPFSVSEDEVQELYSDTFSIQKLLSKDVINEESGLKNRGLTALTETVYKLVRK